MDTTADASDDDQMVICEEVVVTHQSSEIDLKCKEKVTDSDSESHSDIEPPPPQQHLHIKSQATSIIYPRFSSSSGSPVPGEITHRPKPIKPRNSTSSDNRLMSGGGAMQQHHQTASSQMVPTSTVNVTAVATTAAFSVPYQQAPVNPSGVTGFQPTAGGAFKTMPISPKVIGVAKSTSGLPIGTATTVGSLLPLMVKTELLRLPINTVGGDGHGHDGRLGVPVTNSATSNAWTGGTLVLNATGCCINTTEASGGTTGSAIVINTGKSLDGNTPGSWTIGKLTSKPPTSNTTTLTILKPTSSNQQHKSAHSDNQQQPVTLTFNLSSAQTNTATTTSVGDLQPLQYVYMPSQQFHMVKGGSGVGGQSVIVTGQGQAGIACRVKEEPKTPAAFSYNAGFLVKVETPTTAAPKPPDLKCSDLLVNSPALPSPRVTTLNISEHHQQQHQQQHLQHNNQQIAIAAIAAASAAEDSKEFKLAPTPAQLGKAPLQRRQSMVTTPISSAGSSAPSTPLSALIDPPMSAPPIMHKDSHMGGGSASGADSGVLASPAIKKSFFKKNVEDGMDKVLEQVNFQKKFSSLPEFKPDECQSPSAIATTTTIPSSPRLYNNYQKRRPSLVVGQRLSVDGGMPADDETPLATPLTCGSGITPGPGSAAGGGIAAGQRQIIEGNQFFGPDFNLDSLKELASDGASATSEMPISPHTPKTPGTGRATGGGGNVTGGSNPPLSAGGAGDSEKGHRKMLEMRRSLVMQLFQTHTLFPSNKATSDFQALHTDIFPTKGSLQLKIREVRQKLMSTQSSSNCPLSANSLSSPLTPSAHAGTPSSAPPATNMDHPMIPSTTAASSQLSTFSTNNAGGNNAAAS